MSEIENERSSYVITDETRKVAYKAGEDIPGVRPYVKLVLVGNRLEAFIPAAGEETHWVYEQRAVKKGDVYTFVAIEGAGGSGGGGGTDPQTAINTTNIATNASNITALQTLVDGKAVDIRFTATPHEVELIDVNGNQLGTIDLTPYAADVMLTASSFDNSTGVLSLTLSDGNIIPVNLSALGNVNVASGVMNGTDLELTLNDTAGTVITVDLSSLEESADIAALTATVNALGTNLVLNGNVIELQDGSGNVVSSANLAGFLDNTDDKLVSANLNGNILELPREDKDGNALALVSVDLSAFDDSAAVAANTALITALSTTLGALDGVNLGGHSEVFIQRNGDDFEFRTLKNGEGISFLQGTSDIEVNLDSQSLAIEGTPPDQSLDDIIFYDRSAGEHKRMRVGVFLTGAGAVTAGVNVGTGGEVFKSLATGNMNFRTILATEGVKQTQLTDEIELRADIPGLTEIAEEVDFGNDYVMIHNNSTGVHEKIKAADLVGDSCTFYKVTETDDFPAGSYYASQSVTSQPDVYVRGFTENLVMQPFANDPIQILASNVIQQSAVATIEADFTAYLIAEGFTINKVSVCLTLAGVNGVKFEVWIDSPDFAPTITGDGVIISYSPTTQNIRAQVAPIAAAGSSCKVDEKHYKKTVLNGVTTWSEYNPSTDAYDIPVSPAPDTSMADLESSQVSVSSRCHVFPTGASWCERADGTGMDFFAPDGITILQSIEY